MSKVLVISTSLRVKSNSDILTERLIAGARDAGHEVEQISLKGKELKFCIGCLSCQKTQKCVLNDDAVWIAEKVKNADPKTTLAKGYSLTLDANGKFIRKASQLKSGDTIKTRLADGDVLSVVK